MFKVGCDIVCVSRFEKLLREGGDAFRERLFSPSECEGASLERLAGIFAVKEAACKASGVAAGNWRQFCISHTAAGTPELHTTLPCKKMSVSIAHDGDYAFAVVVIES